MQVLKKQVRAEFVAAASGLFAEVGYEATTMGAIAERARSSVGNLYKYFSSKEALFEVVVPADFVEEVRRRTKERIAALGTIRDIRLVPADARYWVLAGDLLELCLAHREAIVILLGKSEGTPHATFAEDFTGALVRWALDYAKGAWPTVRPTDELRFALQRIYRNFLAGIADAFMTFRDHERIREAVAHLTAYHQGGLKDMFETAAGSVERGAPDVADTPRAAAVGVETDAAEGAPADAGAKQRSGVRRT